MSHAPGPESPYEPSAPPYGSTAPGPSQPGYDPNGPYGQPYGQPFTPGQSPVSTALPWRTGSDDNTFALLAHLLAIFTSFVAPLIIFLTKGKQSGYVRDQSLEALNFSITVAIGYVISSVLTIILIGFVLYFVVGIAALVFGILATIAASKGETYRYPFTLRLVK